MVAVRKNRCGIDYKKNDPSRSVDPYENNGKREEDKRSHAGITI